MKKLRTQLSAGFAMIVLVEVFLVSLVSNLCISRQFEQYIAQQQKTTSDDLAAGLALQYDPEKDLWNLDYIHGFGMYALNDGYILKLYDAQDNVVWDAENHDMTLCHQIMEDISLRMEEKRPELEGDFVTHQYPLTQNGTIIGRAEISYYSPYYFNENAFRFLDSLNTILLAVGVISLLGAVFAGAVLAKRIAAPIVKTTQITKEISEGNYGIRFVSQSRTRELNELTQAVNQMAEALEKQENMRKRLVTDVAHELRTPLANVSAQLETVLEGVWEATTERLQACYDEIGRMSQMVSDLERLQQVENENLKLERAQVDLYALAQTVAASFDAELAAKGLHCTVTGTAAVVPSDKRRLCQVVTNLLSNALKYTGEGGHIRIRVEDASDRGILIVEDDGIGIPEADLALVFERFYRTDCSRSRKTGGVGIGLTIVKAIVKAHGGEVSAESREGQGSRFTVVLPK